MILCSYCRNQLTIVPWCLVLCMAEHLSEKDLDRIAEFNATPRYEREPDQLVPDADE